MKNQKGQVLVVLLFFILAAITVITIAVSLMVINATSTSRFEQGIETQAIAESGMENALMRLIRDPNYSGETLTIGSGSAKITVTGSTNKTVISVGSSSDFTRRIQVNAVYINGFITVTSWKEI